MNNEVHLVTGATGFVGSCIVRKLISKKKRVSIITRDKKLNRRLHDIRPRLDIYECDLLNDSLQKVISKISPTYIYHLAAYGATSRENDEGKMIETNFKGTLNLIRASASASLKLFINTGSSSEYGIYNTSLKETMNLMPVNLYGVTKASQTILCSQIAKKEKLPVVTLRLFSPYGPFEDRERLIPHVILNAIQNKTIQLSSKEFVRDYIHINDVVSAYTDYLKVMGNFSGEVFNIGSGKQHSVHEVASRIVAILDSRSSLQWNKVPAQARQIEPEKWEANIGKANKLLKWEPKISFNQGMNMAVDWFKENMHIYQDRKSNYL